VIIGFVVLLACQLVGEVLVRVTGAPLPGPVAGMVVLLVVLSVRRPRPDAPVLRAADSLLTHLQLLFVPVGVGVVTSLAVFRDETLPVVGGLVGAWVICVVVTGLTAVGLLRVQAAVARRRRRGARA